MTGNQHERALKHAGNGEDTVSARMEKSEVNPKDLCTLCNLQG